MITAVRKLEVKKMKSKSNKFAVIIMTYEEKRLDNEEAHREVNDFITKLGVNENNRIVVTEGGISTNRAVHHHVACSLKDAKRIMEAWNPKYTNAFNRTAIECSFSECQVESVFRYLTNSCPARRDEIKRSLLQLTNLHEVSV